MPEPLITAGIASVRVSDYTVRSLYAVNEPDSQKRKSYADLTASLPDQAACDEVGMSFRNIVTTPVSIRASRFPLVLSLTSKAASCRNLSATTLAAACG